VLIFGQLQIKGAQPMEWLEIIKVRMGGAGDRELDPGFLQRIKASLKAPSLAEARVYNNISVSNDLVIILTWLKEIPAPWGSDLASSLTQELKRCGLVDYSAWACLD
jgi:hypothetical protein